MKLSEEDRFEQLKIWFKSAKDASHDWRQEARQTYDFVAGHQWDQEDIDKLKLEERPIITFNRTGSVIDSVSGLEVTNRQEVRYIPRTQGVARVNELLTSAANWVRDECNAEDEESDSFIDLIVCGIGCTETRIDYDEDPEGKAVVLRTDPLEMFADASARRRNFNDARHVFRLRQVPLEDAREMVKDAEDEDLHAKWADDLLSSVNSPHNATEAPFYQNDQSPELDKRTRKVTMVEAQWWELEKAYRVVDPATKKVSVLTKFDFDRLNERVDAMRAQGMQMPPLTSAEVRKRKYKKALLGAKLLKEWDGPEEGGFTYKFMTGKRDRNKNSWYGLVRAMMDPQRWANKWLSQVLHIVNTNAKGGIMAESDAFESASEAQETWSDPAAITLVAPGALQNKKIQPKPVSAYPQGIDHLMQFAISSIRDVAGVNLELLGMAQKDQPGVLEAQRKQAGMTILAGLFDSLRHYRKDQGKLLLWYITSFLADGRLIRIGGPENAQYVPLIHEDGVAEYDVIVDDTPSSPNQKEQTWAILTQLMPFLVKMPLPPQVLFEFLKQSPLPASFVADLERVATEAQQGQGQQPNPEVMKVQAQAENDKAKTQIAAGKAETDKQLAQSQIVVNTATAMKTMAEAKSAETQPQMDAVQMILEAMMQQAQASHEMSLSTQQQQHDQQLAQQAHDSEQQRLQQSHALNQSTQMQQADQATQQSEFDQEQQAAKQQADIAAKQQTP